MDDTRIVEQQERPGLGQREAHPMRAVRFENAGFTTFDLMTCDQQYGNEVDAIPMGPLRRRTSDAVRRIDAKLMTFDEPRLRNLPIAPKLRADRADADQ